MDQINEKLNNEDFKNYNEETAETLFCFNILKFLQGINIKKN